MKERWTIEELPVHAAPSAEPKDVLLVTGLEGKPRTIGLADLARMPQTALTEDFVYEEGWTVPGQTWSGVLVGDIFDEATVDGDGQWVEFAAGEFAFSSPVADARGALVALSLNGEPLSLEHGGPFRLYVPGEACYTSIKWLDRIEVRRDAGPNKAAAIASRRLPAKAGTVAG